MLTGAGNNRVNGPSDMPGPTLTHTRKTRLLIVAGCALLSVLLISISLVLWDERRTESPLLQQPVGSLAAGTSLRIERTGFAPIALLKQADNHWRIIEPCDLPANSQRLQPLLESLIPAAHSYASREVDLEAAGLIEPEAVLYLDEQRLALGTTDLSGERRYLQRADRVEFVPEWILSLVNGGLSALALPDVFPEGLDAIRVVTSSTDDTVPADQDGESLTRWAALTAQQVVSWPLADGDDAAGSQTLLATIAGRESTLTVHDYERFAAIRFENAACAYIINRSSLPDSVFP